MDKPRIEESKTVRTKTWRVFVNSNVSARISLIVEATMGESPKIKLICPKRLPHMDYEWDNQEELTTTKVKELRDILNKVLCCEKCCC